MHDSEQSIQPRPLLGLTRDELIEQLTQIGAPRFRADQVLQAVFEQGATEYASITTLPKAVREDYAHRWPLFESEVVRRAESADGTTKLLLQWADGATSECVLIPDPPRMTACISTQVGCPVRCVFCASGLEGLQRQLHAAQIVEQAMRVRQLCGGERLSNVVFMGLGEPLANYQNTLRALRVIMAPWGMGIGARKLTVSTVGVPSQMRRLADEGMQVTLALSLHAPTDELRREIIPWAERVEIAELVEACNYYFDRTGREVTLEYILLGGLNDQPEHARQLATVARRMRSNVNLIAYNPVEGLPYDRPRERAVVDFLEVLRSKGVNAHVRRSRGLDIDAACGQLRRRVGQEQSS